jgi:accessory gene regulator B
MDTEIKCIITTVCSFVIPGTILSKIDFKIHFGNIFIISISVFVICLLLLIKYSPRDCVNRPIDDNEAIIFKKKSVRDFIILILISIILAFLGQPILSISILAGIVIEIFSLVPIGYRFFELINSSY